MSSKFNVQIRAEVRDPGGKLLKRGRWIKANSLLKQFIQLLTVQLSQASLNILDLAGASGAVAPAAIAFAANALAGQTVLGTVIGTGTNAVTMTDFKLQAQVTASITHSIETIALTNPDSSTWRVELSRTFTNLTGSTLQIREVALYFNTAGSAHNQCGDRTLYSVDVANGLSVVLTYRITISL